MTRPVDPIMQLQKDAVEAVAGKGYYTQVWNALPWYKRTWYTLRGLNPGGRKGAPPLD